MAIKKYLDEVGLAYVLGKLDDYPDNEILAALVDAVQDGLDEKVNKNTATSEIPAATTSTNGLMSAVDKNVLNTLNPNVNCTYSDLYMSGFEVHNAKQENLVDILLTEPPHIAQQIRTSNLLNINDEEVTPGYYISSGGSPSASTNNNDSMGPFIPVTAGQDIYYTGVVGPTTSSSINRRLHVYNANKTWIKQISFAGSLKVGDSWSTHGTVPSNGAYIRVSWGMADYNVMLSVGAPTKYEPYYITPFEAITSTSFQIANNSELTNANTYTITVPNNITAYGFNYNPIEGKLYLTTGYIASYDGETLPGLWWSDRDTYTEGGTPTTNAEVVYMLDENDVIEYDITALTIPLFYQHNYFYVPTGEIVNLSYYAETLAANHFTVYNGVQFGSTNIDETSVIGWNHASDIIDNKADLLSPVFDGTPASPTPSLTTNSDRIATTAFTHNLMNMNVAPLERTSTASQNYTVGSYLYQGGKLYKVTQAISSGATITPGTNTEQTTITNELMALFAAIS